MNYVTFWPVLTRTSLAGFNAPIDKSGMNQVNSWWLSEKARTQSADSRQVWS